MSLTAAAIVLALALVLLFIAQPFCDALDRRRK